MGYGNVYVNRQVVPQSFWKAISPQGVTSLIGCRMVQQRQTHAQNSSTRSRTGLWSLSPLVKLQAHRCVHREAFLTGHHVRDQIRMRDLEITSAYQELRRATLNGRYAHIRDMVRILVRERGQKPNLKLYDALLLANTDSQNGSAGEVARILDEIAMEGLVPDSATYHAALKVR